MVFTKQKVNNRGTDGGRAMTTIESLDRTNPIVHPVVALDDPAAENSQVTGAKAAALARAAASGLPVLPGMVVTTDAFTRPAADVEADLHVAWATMSDHARRPIVVRSSSTIEDNAGSSMAGMFTSVLDVRSWEGFRMALDTVLASSNVVALTGPEARSRVRAPMAVLVQPQLAATVGGVLFGLDPVSGRRDRLVVSASDAGPSAVVSGEVDGTRYVLSRRGRRLDGPTRADGPLTPSQLRRLAALARHAEQVFGGPQDVEWAFGPDGRLWLLQSRPITAAAADTVGARGPVLGPGPVAETFPDALSALEEDLWVGPLRDGLRTALSLAGTAPRRRLATSPVVTTAGGRVAADLELLGAADGPTSFLRRIDPRPPARRLVAAWRV
ncbi:MAG TPA: PEP/pyruvate-binding domain-containing protein, partial [Acidimicrobiales bacterium]